jgi:hypothetical protein
MKKTGLLWVMRVLAALGCGTGLFYAFRFFNQTLGYEKMRFRDPNPIYMEIVVLVNSLDYGFLLLSFCFAVIFILSFFIIKKNH